MHTQFQLMSNILQVILKTITMRFGSNSKSSNMLSVICVHTTRSCYKIFVVLNTCSANESALRYYREKVSD